MTETPRELVIEMKEVLAPAILGLNEDNPVAALRWTVDQMLEYVSRILNVEVEHGDNGRND